MEEWKREKVGLDDSATNEAEGRGRRGLENWRTGERERTDRGGDDDCIERQQLDWWKDRGGIERVKEASVEY